MPRDTLSYFTDAYIEAALWFSTDDDGTPLNSIYSVADLAPETLKTMKADCCKFYTENEEAIWCDGAKNTGGDQTAQAGHDFWLTRCGHGAGFWDGDWPEPHATTLTAAAEAFGNVDLYVGDDGEIYQA